MRRYISRSVVWFGLFFLVVVLVAAQFWHSASYKQMVPSCTDALSMQQTSPMTSKDMRTVPPLYLGLDAYRHWDKLSYLEVGDRVEGWSSADPGGTNHDNKHIVRKLPNGERVLFDQVGPGIVTFMRMQQAIGAPWQLAVDDRTSTFSRNDLGQLDPTVPPSNAFAYPLSLNPDESHGSSILASAIPFEQKLTWTAQHDNGNFYALYRKLPYGTPLTAWNSQTDNSDVVRLLRCSGSDIAPGRISQQSGEFAPVGGTETSLVTLHGQQQIRALTLQVPARDMIELGNARLLIYWDGETRPSVDAPLKFLAGDGAGVYQPATRPLVQGWIAGISNDASGSLSFNLYWPMPFSAQARLAVLADKDIKNVKWSVRSEPFTDPEHWWGTFHATYTSVAQPQAGQDMTFLDVQGSGKLVGTVINFTAPDNTLEGDPHIYLDESQTPQIAVTGTEEWGLGGNYWNKGQQVSLPLGGLPSSIDNPPGSHHDGAALYRFLIADSIAFNRHLTVRWEHGPLNDIQHPYRATMLWYGRAIQTAALSDEVLPAEQESRTAHQYQAASEQRYEMTAAYEYLVHSPLLTLSGIATTAPTSFTMKLDPHNVGAFLRRTFDDCVADQRAKLYLDDAFAGTWYDAGVSSGNGFDGHRRCWRDEDFPLPAALTSGKSSVRVRIEYDARTEPQGSKWTTFRYQMYSFGNYSAATAPTKDAATRVRSDLPSTFVPL